MKRLISFVVIALFFLGCKEKVDVKELSKINGYWEIERVVLPEGDEKEYKVNTTIDFFKIQDNKGFRKKVMPQIDGTYLMNNLEEKVEVIATNAGVYLNYTTNYSKWKEELIRISDEELVIKNEQDLEYHYKRAKPFTIK